MKMDKSGGCGCRFFAIIPHFENGVQRVMQGNERKTKVDFMVNTVFRLHFSRFTCRCFSLKYLRTCLIKNFVVHKLSKNT